MYAITKQNGLADDGIIPLVGVPPGGFEAHQNRVQTGITTPANNDLMINKLLFDIRSGFTVDNKFNDKDWSDFLEKNDIEQKFSAYGYSVSYKTLTWVGAIIIGLLTYLWLS